MISSRRRVGSFLAACCPLVLLAAGTAEAQLGGGGYPLPIGSPQIVILILADDVGQDVLSVYDLGGACSVSGTLCHSSQDCPAGQTCQTDYARTPRLDDLAGEGVVFHNTWANPVCSPTRATIQTGRYGFRTGMGAITTKTSIHSLPLSELAIPEILDAPPAPVSWEVKHAAIGKWHLTSFITGSEDHPRQTGYGHYAGSMFNLGGESYFEWTKHVNGTAQPGKVTTYATTENVDDALAWIDSVTPDGTPGDPLPMIGYQPLFLYLAFNAAHAPWEAPPMDPGAGLLSQATISRLRGLGLSTGDSCEQGSSHAQIDQRRRACYLAAIEAMDSEIGRLLDGLPASAAPHTTVIFVGDNGTAQPVTRPPFDPRHAKASLYQGGINVPLIISGAAVTGGGRHADDLVNTTDLFATSLELATGFALDDLLPAGHVHDSISLLPILDDVPGFFRAHAYAEGFADIGPGLNHRKAIRGDVHKLIRNADGTEELYDLSADPLETDPLDLTCDPAPDCQHDPDDPCCAYGELTAELEALAATETSCLIPARCEDCESCDRLDVFGQDICDPSVFVPVSSCLRPHPNGAGHVTCEAPSGIVQVDRCFCEKLTPFAVCFPQDSILTGLRRADGSGLGCWSNAGL